MRVVGVDISNHFTRQLTRLVEGGLNNDELAGIEARVPDALVSIKRKADTVITMYAPLKSAREHWLKELGYERTENSDVSHFVKVLATGFEFSRILAVLHRERGGNTLIGCIRDLGLEADNNEYVKRLTDISKRGLNGVPQNARADFCTYLPVALEQIMDRFAHFSEAAGKLLIEFENKKGDME